MGCAHQERKDIVARMLWRLRRVRDLRTTRVAGKIRRNGTARQAPKATFVPSDKLRAELAARRIVVW